MKSLLFGVQFASISFSPLVATAADGFAIIQDSDGFANVREAPDLKGNIVGKATHGSLVYCTGEEKDGWLAISFRDGKEEKYGFVHGSRAVPVRSFTEVPAITEEDRRIVFSSESVRVEVEKGDFDAKKATVTREGTSGPQGFIKEIDGKPFWGTDGGLPRTRYANIAITQGKRRTVLPAEATDDLFEPNLSPDLMSVAHDEKTDTIIISASNSDGAGGYVVAFRIVKGAYLDRCVLGPF